MTLGAITALTPEHGEPQAPVACGRHLLGGCEKEVHTAVQAIFTQSFLTVPVGSQPDFSRIRISSGGEEEWGSPGDWQLFASFSARSRCRPRSTAPARTWAIA